MIKMKTCTCCGIEKELDEFPSNVKNGKRYFRGRCKACRNKQRRELNAIEAAIREATKVINIIDYIKPAFKVCTCCGETKLLHLFNKEKNGKYGRKSKCIDCHTAYKQQPHVKQRERERTGRRTREGWLKECARNRLERSKLYNEFENIDPGLKQLWQYQGHPFDKQNAIELGFTDIVYEMHIEDGMGIVLNNSFYIGKKGMFQNDFSYYMGSSKNPLYLEYAIKYPQNVKRIITHLFKSDEEAKQKELELFDLHRVQTPDQNPLCLNIKRLSACNTNYGTMEENFWKKVNVPDDKSECWIWTGAFHKRGQEPSKWKPSFGVLGRSKEAYRVMIEDIQGETIPDGMYVGHICNDMRCVNPDHLFFGTPSEIRLHYLKS